MKLAPKLAEYLANKQFNLCYHLLPPPGSKDLSSLANHKLLLLAIQHHAPQDIIDRLIKVPGLVIESDEMGCTPLHLACGRGDGELISRVLDAGGWVDAVDVFDHTPLRTGIWSRAGLSVYQLLVQHGANCNIQDDRGWTPLNDLIQVNAGLDCFQLLLQQGRANPTTCQASNGWTLLHDALAKSIHLDILQLLLKSGCGKLVHRESGSGLLPLAMVPNPSTSRQLLLTAFLAEQLVVILSINQLPIELVRLLKEYL